MSTRVPLCVPNIGAYESEFVEKCLRSGYVSSAGPEVRQFEREFASYIGSEYAVACSSGTASIHLALCAAGVSPGDRVAVSDFTFIASANPIMYLGAIPILIDSDASTWNISPQIVSDYFHAAARKNQLPKVLVVAHILGQPAEMDELVDLCSDFNVTLVEDAAEALGTIVPSKSNSSGFAGSVGDLGCFSFNGNKTITTGSGGMLVTNSSSLADTARHLSTQAKVSSLGYLHDRVGFNYRMNNVSAALGLAQLRRLDEFIDSKRANAAAYTKHLTELPLTTHPVPMKGSSSYWLYSVLVASQSERDGLLGYLQKSGCESRALWRPLHMQPPFELASRYGNDVGVDLFNRGISLPSSTSLTEEEMMQVIESIRNYFAGS